MCGALVRRVAVHEAVRGRVRTVVAVGEHGARKAGAVGEVGVVEARESGMSSTVPLRLVYVDMYRSNSRPLKLYWKAAHARSRLTSSVAAHSCA